MPYRELILRVKEAKAATGITYKEIEERTKAIGSQVSESSIKRIFAEGSENKTTRNDKTLMPIASVLLDPSVIREALTPTKEAPQETLDIIAMKEDRIDVLKRQMKTEEEDYQQKIDELNRQLERKDEDHREMVAILNRQIEKTEETMKERISYLKERIARSDKIIRMLSISIGVLIFAVVISLGIDNLHPHIDWLSEADSTFVLVLGAVIVLAAVLSSLKFLRKK